MDYAEYANIMKALSDPKRVKILNLLSCGSLCACEVLEHFDFTQPTLSHHIKVLVEAGLVGTQKRGTWHYYSLNPDAVDKLVSNTLSLFSGANPCICQAEQNPSPELDKGTGNDVRMEENM